MLQQLDEHQTVAFLFLFAGAGKDERVGGRFAVDAHPAEGEPEHRVEPVEDLQQRDERLHGDVAALEMGQLVEKDEAQFDFVEFGADIGGQKQRGLEEAHDGGTLHLRAFHETDRAADAEFGLGFGEELPQLGIGHRGRVGNLARKAAVHLPGQNEQGKRADQPYDREQRVNRERVAGLCELDANLRQRDSRRGNKKRFAHGKSQRGGWRRRELEEAQGALGHSGQNQSQHHQKPERVSPARIEP